MNAKNTPVILVINTGSTSTKIAVYKGIDVVLFENTSHQSEELALYSSFEQQIAYRSNVISKILLQNNIDIDDIDMIMCRGGLIRPVASGVYEVNDKMIHDLKHAKKQHASNFAAVIGTSLATRQKVLIADPVVVDELQDIARYAGHKDFSRTSIFHALNHKAVARKYAGSIDKNYDELNLIVAHLGGGISVGAHQKGSVIDVNQALDGEGPFSPERSGTLPAGDLIAKAFSGEYTYADMKKMLVGKGGLVSYTGSNNVQAIESNPDKTKHDILHAMAYQISKSIGEMVVVLQGNVDTILLTGGVAHSKLIVDAITKYVSFLAPVVVYPGEDEMEALAYNGLLVWKNELKVQAY